MTDDAVDDFGVGDNRDDLHFRATFAQEWSNNVHMREITKQPYGSWADVEQYAIHSVERQQVHEAIHCYSRVIGWPSDFFTEGIAVALDIDPYTGEEVQFFGAPVHALCRRWLAEENLYPLSS